MRVRGWLVVLALSACGDNTVMFDAPPAPIDSAVSDAVDAMAPVEATTFVTGPAPACSTAVPTTDPCLAQAAASAWGSCTVPDGWNSITDAEAPFPAVAIGGTTQDCIALAFVDTACGPAVVAWQMGTAETSWSGFSLAGSECWMAEFGRLCTALVPAGTHEIRWSSCEAGAIYSCSGEGTATAVVSGTGALVGFDGFTSGCFPGGGGSCSCW